ncbi:MAG: ribosome assembly RNA-binding protein YhbY [Thiohalomonadaceae bacterium]
MPLNQKQKSHLRKLAHSLKPVVIIGNAGLSTALLAELDTTLEHHELIKVRVNAEDRQKREIMMRELCEKADCELVQSIGHIVVIYRKVKKPQLQLPA